MNGQRFIKFYHGYITGTNRGNILLKLKYNGGLIAKILFYDHLHGYAILKVKGNISGNEAKFNLSKFDGDVGLSPITGNIFLKFDDSWMSASGSWETDIGTNGKVYLEKIKISSLNWLIKNIWYSIIIKIKDIYIPFLIITAILNMFSVIHLSYISIILLLFPCFYIYRKYITEILDLFGIIEIGPLKRRQKLPPKEMAVPLTIFPPEPSYFPLYFPILDNFFVIKTKYLLSWIAQRGVVERPLLINYALSIGIPLENIEDTISALLQTHCIRVENNNIFITELGKKYVEHLFGA